jgi:hypothetical protein
VTSTERAHEVLKTSACLVRPTGVVVEVSLYDVELPGVPDTFLDHFRMTEEGHQLSNCRT